MTESRTHPTPAPAPAGDPGPPSLEELVGVEVRLEEARFELKLAQEANARLEQEVRRLEQRLAARNAENTSLRSQLEEKDRYIAAIRTSTGWKALQALRGVLGRQWAR